MARATIDYGIDLGTTNSSIAVIGKNGPRIIAAREGGEVVPSAVYIDKDGKSHVGKSAKQRLITDEPNTAARFKRWMGTNQTKNFQRSGLVFNAEQLSAEVLKALREDAMARGENDTNAAVITVPADFDQPQCHATKRAAALAGIELSPLLMEPVAAALAYGFDHQSENVFWLVFDLGGGTFDAALIRVRDGFVQVVNHGGDNFLGGTNLDWAIVDQLLVPALQKQFSLTDFTPKNPRWLRTFAKLVEEAENAKIHVSSFDSKEIYFDHLCDDDAGSPVEFDFVLTRSHVAQLIEPIAARAIDISKRVLSEQKLGPGDIEKLILVGGPTLTPHLRKMLSEPQSGLGIPLEYSLDPLTVVAQGAAIFAATQKRGVESTRRDAARGSFVLQLEYKPIAVDTEPLVGGKVVQAPVTEFEGHTIEFFNHEARPAWRSGKIRLSREGTFVTSLWAESGRRNTFAIELLDKTGNHCRVEPSEIHYMVAPEPGRATLSHNIGVAMANNKVDVFFKKGDELPLKKKSVHATTKEVRRGSLDQRILIPIVEGLDRDEADLNRAIGFIDLRANDIPRDVPLGSEVEITLEIDESRILTGAAYIPLIDRELPLNWEANLLKPVPNPDLLRDDVARQHRRLERLARDRAALQHPAATTTSATEGMDSALREMERLVDKAHGADDLFACQNQLLDLKRKLASVERKVELPALKADAQQEIAWTEEIVQAHGTSEDKRNWELLKQDIIRSLDGNPEDLRQKVSSANDMRMRLSVDQMWWWVGLQEYLASRRHELADQQLADRWFAHNQRAITNGDFEALKAGCRNLWALLPVEEQTRGYGGTTIRAGSGMRGASSV